jgi:glutamyl/glutaminyl-tRNA synthetase
MNIIYGVDTEKSINPKDVRDAIIECFTQAHTESLFDLEDYNKNLSKIELEEIKRINTRQMIRNFFEETGGHYDNPTKESILKMLEKLKEFAQNFRDKSIIEKNFNEILILIKKL